MEPLGDGDPRWVGAYRLLGRLGAGGMGRVYLARSDRGRTVAVKVVQEELAGQPAFRERFAKEVTAARRVGGEWTAPVLDADTEAATPWVATGYIAGPSLQAVVDTDYGPLPDHSVYALAAGLVEALRAIHGAGLVHRDLKPSNVLVTIDGPRVIDFGIARALDTVTTGGLTQTGAVIGSPGFMSPEQVRGLRVTPASDVFCLGSVLAYAATGRMPFGADGSGFHALMFRIAEEAPELDGLSEPLRGLVADCLAKDPAARPSPDDLAARVAEHAPAGGPWLPGEVLAQLGRHAVQLLDTEDPDALGSFGAPSFASSAVPPTAPAVPAVHTSPPVPPMPPSQGFAGPGPLSTPPPYPTMPATGPYGPPHQVAHQMGHQPVPQWHSTPPPPVTAPYQAVAAPSDSGPVRSARGLCRWLCTGLGVLLLFTLVELVFNLNLLDELDRMPDDAMVVIHPDYDAMRTATETMAAVGGLLFLAVAVLWLAWLWRIRTNAEVFAPGRVRYHRWWAVFSWFLPVVGLFMPKQILNDICDHSDPASVPAGWHGAPRSGNRGLLNGWWTLWLITMIGGVLFSSAVWYEESTISLASGNVVFQTMLDFLTVPATVLAMLVVLRLTALQEHRVTPGH
ncbi:MAG TPA: DUF4328 domain-containing protein [Streptomyces sp.]|nr:DUF4328 domain-containing protein [Streptomyces sp.]